MPTITVSGMSCQHCADSVTKALEGLGAKRVRVDLSTGRVEYQAAEPIAPEALRAAMERLGFGLAG